MRRFLGTTPICKLPSEFLHVAAMLDGAVQELTPEQFEELTEEILNANAEVTLGHESSGAAGST